MMAAIFLKERLYWQMQVCQTLQKKRAGKFKSLFVAGSGLMGFYRLHMLEIVSIEFLVVPLLMVVGGTFAFFTSIFGFYATTKEDSCLLITHSVFMTIEFCILIAGIISSVRLIFFIQTGLFNADVIPELNLYEANTWIRYKWDTLQSKFLTSRQSTTMIKTI
jgi:hypothetical protein